MNLKPLNRLTSAGIFLSASLLLWVMTHQCIPYLSHTIGYEPILSWFICGGIGVFLPLIVAGVVMLHKEGYPLDRKTFAGRLRFKPMTRKDWICSLIALIVIGAATAVIMLTMQAIDPAFDHTPPFMAFKPLTDGRYWLLLAWLPFWLLNIGGEEFFWRGVLFPRQEKTSGKRAWIGHGTGWALFHLAFGWQLLIMLLPLLYIESYVVQKTQNSWTGVFLHGAVNGGGFIAISLGWL